MGDGSWTLSGSPGPTEESSSEEDRHAATYASTAVSLEPPAGVAAEARVATPKITITATRDTICAAESGAGGRGSVAPAGAQERIRADVRNTSR